MTGQLFRCIKAFIVDILIGRLVEEDGKAREKLLRGKFGIKRTSLRCSFSTVFNTQVTAFQAAGSKRRQISVVTDTRRRDYVFGWQYC